MDEITPETLRGREGESFTIGGIPADLVSLKTNDGPGIRATIAVFRSGTPHGVVQASATVRHPDLADTELLAVGRSPTELCVTFTSLLPN